MPFLYASHAPQAIYNQIPLEIYPNGLGDLGQPDMPSCLQNTALAAKGATTISIRPTGKAWKMKHGRFLQFVDPETRKPYLAVLKADIGENDTSISVEPLDEAIPANCFVDYPYRCYGRLESSLVPEQNYTGSAPLETSGFTPQSPTDYKFGGSFQIQTSDLDATLLQARYQGDHNLPIFIRDINPSPRSGWIGQIVQGNYYISKPEEPKTADTRISTFQLQAITEPERIRPQAGDDLFGKILCVVVSGNNITIYGHGLDGLSTVRYGTTKAAVDQGGTPTATSNVTTNNGVKISSTLPENLQAGSYFIGLTDAGQTRFVVTDYSRFTK